MGFLLSGRVFVLRWLTRFCVLSEYPWGSHSFMWLGVWAFAPPRKRLEGPTMLTLFPGRGLGPERMRLII